MFTPQNGLDAMSTDAAKTIPSAAGIDSYTPPSLNALGNLECVQDNNGPYYDGPNTTWCRYE